MSHFENKQHEHDPAEFHHEHEHAVPQPPAHELHGEQHSEHGEHQHDPFADSPGRDGPHATLEIDPHSLGTVHTSYTPKHDREPDPGEIVWTWVPYEEHDGRGKDRPVLIVAREPESETFLAVKLTSKWHADAENWVDVGNGHWDYEARESWAVIDRVMRVHHEGIRRESCALDKDKFDLVIEHLDKRYHWK